MKKQVNKKVNNLKKELDIYVKKYYISSVMNNRPGMTKKRHYFESRHVNEILGINKDRLHRWTQTKNLILPVKRGKGRGGRNKFSFENLLELDIIKLLDYCGLDLNVIEIIMKAIRNFKQESYEYTTTKPISLWTYIRNNKRRYNKQTGGFLVILPDATKKFNVRLLTKKELVKHISFKDLEYKGAILIEILAIIERMEEKTGMKLSPPKEGVGLDKE